LALLLTETVIIGYGQDTSPGKRGLKDVLHAATLPPCQACKVYVDSFMKVRSIIYGILVLWFSQLMSDVQFWLSLFSAALYVEAVPVL
jgi:hypothetical protein